MQCPYNHSNRLILEQIDTDYEVNINYFDLTHNHDLAKEMKLYSPTMTIFNKQLRWSGPITYELVEKYLNGEIPSRNPYLVKSHGQLVTGTLQPFTPERTSDIKDLCCARTCKESADKKKRWLQDIMKTYAIHDLGVLRYVKGTCVGGAEYVPSLAVPYDIPKAKEFAFVTCVYASDPVYDFKTHPLHTLHDQMKKQGYQKLYAIASDNVAFPNGPLNWFIKNGYTELGHLYYEENDGAHQHLVEIML